MPVVSPSAQRARQTAEIAQWLALAAIILILLTLAASYGAASLQELESLSRDNPPSLADQINAVLRVWIWALAPLLFVGALWHLRKALEEYAQGRFFSPESARAVRLAGEQAVYALVAQVVVSPSLDAWTSGAFRGVVWKFESVHVAMVAFAVFVAAVGRVLDLAVAIKAENDEIV